MMSGQSKSTTYETDLTASDSRWNSLYKIGAVSAFIFVIYSLVTMYIFLVVGGQPESVIDIFTLLEANRLEALLRLDVLTFLTVPLYYPIFLSMYTALRRSNLSYATLATLLAFAGVTLFLATPTALSMVLLSDKYAAAPTQAQKEQLLAAGEALLVLDTWHSTAAFIGGTLMLIGALVLSGLMLSSESFSRATAYVGILTHGLDLARVFISFILPDVGVIIMAIAGTLYLIWFPLLARDFLQLGRSSLKG